MLVFECNDSGNELEIHATPEKLTELIEELNLILKNKEDHIHLMTPSWAGAELSEELMDSSHLLIHHVKIYCHWKAKSQSKPQ